MRKTIFAVAAIGLLLATACKKTESKNNNNGSAGGTWTFKSVTYQAPGCDTSSVTIAINATVPSGGTPATGGQLGVDFYSSYPTTAGSFTVIKGISTLANANQTQLGITDLNGVKYISSGSGNSTVSVTVTGGKISITGSEIQLVNLSDTADVSNLTFTIHQTN